MTTYVVQTIDKSMMGQVSMSGVFLCNLGTVTISPPTPPPPDTGQRWPRGTNKHS